MNGEIFTIELQNGKTFQNYDFGVFSRCETCAHGTYSLEDPYEALICQPCENHKAICLGGSKIYPRPGFWRYSLDVPRILRCPNEEACL